MKRVYLENVQEGMVLAKTITSPNGQVLLSQGTVLNNKYINHLSGLGVIFIFIQSELTGDAQPGEAITDKTRSETKKAIKECFNALVKGNKIDVFEISQQVTSILDELVSNPNVLFELSQISINSEISFNHSVNVCILSLLTGLALGFNQLQLRDLGIGAVLHDIGKTVINSKEKSEYQKHPSLGFEILRQYKELNLLAAHVPFQHHEHFDGTGYPRGIKAQDISQYARIVAYADYYDNLITDYPDRKGMKPWAAMTSLRGQIGSLLDPDIADAFFKNLIYYPVGTIIELNTGEMGLVLHNDRQNVHNPLIRIVIDQNKSPLTDPYDIDLAAKTELSITKIYADTDPELPPIFKWEN